MQTEIPNAIDMSEESQKTLDVWRGARRNRCIWQKVSFGRKLVEKGVRFVQLYNGGWDSHDYIERAHSNRVKGVDQPMLLCIEDLKARNLLESTLVVWWRVWPVAGQWCSRWCGIRTGS